MCFDSHRLSIAIYVRFIAKFMRVGSLVLTQRSVMEEIALARRPSVGNQGACKPIDAFIWEDARLSGEACCVY